MNLIIKERGISKFTSVLSPKLYVFTCVFRNTYHGILDKGRVPIISRFSMNLNRYKIKYKVDFEVSFYTSDNQQGVFGLRSLLGFTI